MFNRRLIPTFLLALAVAASTATAGVPPIALDIKYLNGPEPFTTRARVTVEPNATNRYMCLSWTQVQGGGGGRTSCLSLDGASAPRTYWQFLKELSSGRWEVAATVIRNDESRSMSNHILLNVLGPNFEMDTPE